LMGENGGPTVGVKGIMKYVKAGRDKGTRKREGRGEEKVKI